MDPMFASACRDTRDKDVKLVKLFFSVKETQLQVRSFSKGIPILVFINFTKSLLKQQWA